MNDTATWGFVIVVIGLAYFIIYLSNKPYQSKQGQKENFITALLSILVGKRNKTGNIY